MLRCWRNIGARAFAFGHDRDQGLAHRPRLSSRSDVLGCDRGIRHQAAEIRAATCLGAFLGCGDLGFRAAMPDPVGDGLRLLVDDGFNPRLLAGLSAEQETRCDRHLHVRECGVGAGHSPRPDPGNHCRLAAAVLLRQVHLRVEMPDAFPRLLAHPFTVKFYVLSQSFGIAVELPVLRARMDRFLVLELRRDLDHRLADHHRDRIEIGPIGWQAEALRLKRNRPAA